MKSISAIILNSDNRDITKTLASLSGFDEIIVWKKPLNGDWAAARNEAMETAKNDWVLFIDSDEILSQQIAKIDDKYDGYSLRRRDVFWGRELKHGEAGNIKLLRLGRKSAGIWRRKVHEYWDIKNVGELDNKLLHYPHPTVKEFIDSINFYTTIDANELYNEGKRVTYFRLLFNPVGKFIDNYFFNLGFLDGWPGFTYAFLMSFHSLTVRVKMAAEYGFSGLF